mmetsp:Transcript_24554/g.30193  ORF Transcript_24554/g.30193 Transcript_24554/m.30193 type:complete len:310 (+) Transcript_24554:242-1171(+)
MKYHITFGAIYNTVVVWALSMYSTESFSTLHHNHPVTLTSSRTSSSSSISGFNRGKAEGGILIHYMKSSYDDDEGVNKERGEGDFDDYNSSLSEAEEAKELAHAFYEQLKLREEAAAEADQNALSGNNDPNENETYELKKRKSSSSASTKNPRKYTGRISRGEMDSTFTPSAGLFATQNGSVYAIPANDNRRKVYSSRSSSSVKEDMLKKEINFVSLASNEVTLLLQGIFTILALSGAIYVGMSGGITDGSERFGTMDGIANEYNGLGENLDISNYINEDSSLSPQIKGDSVEDYGIMKEESMSASVWI